MLRPRSRLGLFVRIALALALIVLVSIAWIWNNGRVRLEHALTNLRASGGPELPPQASQITEGGKKTAQWFAQFADEEAWTRGELDTADSIDAFLAEHGSAPAAAALASELKSVADALRITNEQVATKAVELERDKELGDQLSKALGIEKTSARSDLESDRGDERATRVRELLERQEPLERWDDLSRAWVLTRGLGHARLLDRIEEIPGLAAFDTPQGRGAGRFELGESKIVFAVQRAVLDLLPSRAIRGDGAGFVQAALAALRLGHMRSRCWGWIHVALDGGNTLYAAHVIRECLTFLPREVELGALESAFSALRPRADALEGLRTERAVGNEIFLVLRDEASEHSVFLDGKNVVERELVRLWWNHEQAGYLEDMQRALDLEPRAPFECEGGLGAYDAIGAELRERHWWRMIRSMITPNFRSQARMTAVLEAEQQLTLLCITAWRDPTSIGARIAATTDPFTGRPLHMREDNGVLVFWSVGEDLHDDAPGAESGDDIVARFRPR